MATRQRGFAFTGSPTDLRDIGSSPSDGMKACCLEILRFRCHVVATHGAVRNCAQTRELAKRSTLLRGTERLLACSQGAQCCLPELTPARHDTFTWHLPAELSNDSGATCRRQLSRPHGATLHRRPDSRRDAE